MKKVFLGVTVLSLLFPMVSFAAISAPAEKLCDKIYNFPEKKRVKVSGNVKKALKVLSKNHKYYKLLGEIDICLDGKMNVSSNSGYIKYDMNKYYSFLYPNTWKISQFRSGNVIGMQVISEKEGENDFLEGANFIVADYTSYKVNYEKYYEINIQDIKDYVSKEGGSFISESDVEVGGKKGKKVVWKAEAESLAYVEQYFFKKGKNAYIVTFGKETGVTEKDKDFERILKSFKIK